MEPIENVYREFMNFDWDSNTEFQEGLKEIFETHLMQLKEQDPTIESIPTQNKAQLTDQAKSFFFCSQTGHILSLDDYYQWRAQHGGNLLNDTNETTGTTEETEASANETNSTPSEYSSKYKDIVNMIVTGQEIPGIKQIPDTVLSEQSSEHKAQQRVKPWEKEKQ
ncbi:Piso0_002518 [Millerozyma farinosa CBS 7064]|uniref:Piso0_002518 protein n=1 Tax=Pichia sorbitophila (strain ATCC MYA-4447 / BCRC 22081 / CBS 7064 / NBRC 10061 / NRRL Y-12695) TaxID=559304 RepID=G8YF92_PICSO|nr:Piso0_002518 [Millerozyma farinosa CBS 7064]